MTQQAPERDKAQRQDLTRKLLTLGGGGWEAYGVADGALTILGCYGARISR